MLGPSLEQLFNICGRKFSLKTVLQLADQMLSRLEFLHDAGFLHRDLKPDNFLMGIHDSERVVYAVDLGLGKAFQSEPGGQHIPYTKGKTRHEKYDKIARKKLSTLPEQLCRGYPEEFAHLIRYSWRLSYEERPNYEQLRRMFREVFFKQRFRADWEYDWDTLGMGATRLAMENHPFIRGNVPGDKFTRRRRLANPNQTQNHAGAAGDDDDDDRKADELELRREALVQGHWGGDKHHQHSKVKRKKRKPPPDSRDRRSMPALNDMNSSKSKPSMKPKTSVATLTRQHSSCIPGMAVQQSPRPQLLHASERDQPQTHSPRKRKWKFSPNFACLQSQDKSQRKSVNTEKQRLMSVSSATFRRQPTLHSPAGEHSR